MCCGIRLRSSHHQFIYTPFNLQLNYLFNSICRAAANKRASKLKTSKKSVQVKIIQRDGIKFLVRWMNILRKNYPPLPLVNKFKKVHATEENKCERERREREKRSYICTALLTCPIGLNKIHNHWFFKRYENSQRYIIDTISNRHHQRKTRKTKSK